MENNNIQIIPVEQEAESTSSVNFVDVIHKCLSNWYWFVISVVLCLGFACFYILRTHPTYHRTATVLIKESAMRRMSTSDLESIMASGTGQVSAKVVNEVIAFQSPALMLEVVERLGLSTSYSVSGLFRPTVIYGAQVPVNVEFIDIPSTYACTLEVHKTEDGISICKLVYYYKKDKFKGFADIKGQIGDTLATPVGNVVVTANPYFEGEWKKPVNVRKTSDLAATTSVLSGFKATSVDVKNRSDVLELSLFDKSVQRADDILNTVIAIYNENWVLDKNKMAISTSNFITERLASLEQELGDVDKNISSYKSSNLIPDVGSVSAMFVEQTRENTKYIQEIDNQLYVYRYIRTYLSDNKRDDQLIPMAGSVSNNGISSQILDYNKMLLNRNNILANSSDKNPLVQDLTNALKATRTAIETSIENQIGTLEDQLAHMRVAESKTNSRIAASPTQIQYLTTVGRQQKVKESLYLYLLQKREENELSQAFTAYNTRIITPPMGVANPSSPKKNQILAIAFFLGLLIPFVFFYVKVLADTKIRSKKDLETLALPFLGEIPQYFPDDQGWLARMFSRTTDAKELLVKEGKRDVINEAFRVLRTNIEFISRGNKCPVMLLTSFNPGSGKTFISMNTSMVLAIKGKKVLAVDGDMRHASLSEFVGSPRKGLSNYLSEQIENWKDVVVEYKDHKNLHVIPVGTLPPNPSELIASERFANMIAEAKKEYDIILLDCPPLDIVADTQIIEEVADRCIFVARAGVMDRSMVNMLEKLSAEKKLKNLSLVLNGTDTAGSYYGTYGYHSYDYYHQKA